MTSGSKPAPGRIEDTPDTLPGNLKERRQVLVDDHSVTGLEWCRRYAEVVDEWMGGCFADAVAVAGDDRGVALLAVGGYGYRQGELAPGSDLDLLLVVDRRGPVRPLAEAIWYPIWNSGIALDHSVRTPREVVVAANSDLKVALGLLTARVVAGDQATGEAVIERAMDQWRSRAPRWLPQVDTAIKARHREHGEVAFLLEPDLKEAKGGLRDIRLLQAVAAISPVLAEVAADPRLANSAATLAAARVELQRVTGKSTNRLMLQDQDAVAAALASPDADDLMADVADAARTVAWAGDDGWRRVAAWLDEGRFSRRRRRPRPDRLIEPGLVVRNDEVALAEGAEPALDASLALRAAAASATSDLPMSRECLSRLEAEIEPVEGTWPPELLQSLLRLFGAGRPAIDAIEALDYCGIWTRLLPEWRWVRHRPQRNAYHRFTVDRHLLEAVANSTYLVREVDRPDLLLMGALLHDIGKGRPGGNHTAIGIDVVTEMAPRLGFDAADAATLVSLVRYHLLLPEIATRRDIDDPITIDHVAAAVGDLRTLELLAALTEADSRATGSAMWTPWKAGLLARLVERVGDRLAGRVVPGTAPALSDDERSLLGTGRLELVADGGRVSVAAPDRRRLLATVAGVLTLSRVTVRSAATHSESGNQAFLRFEVAPAFDVLPDWTKVRSDLEAALVGHLPVAKRLADRERHYGRRRALAPHPVQVRVTADNDAATSSTMVEVRAPDRGPVLYHVALTISEAGFDIVSAIVSTLGAEAIDVFYVQAGRDPLTGTGGRKVADAALGPLEAALTTAIEALA